MIFLYKFLKQILVLAAGGLFSLIFFFFGGGVMVFLGWFMVYLPVQFHSWCFELPYQPSNPRNGDLFIKVLR